MESGVGAVLGEGDLAEGIVGPAPTGGSTECGACGVHRGALADFVDSSCVVHNSVIETRNRKCANFIFLECKNVAGGFPCVGDGVDGAGDGGEEVAVGRVVVLESGVGNSGYGGEASVGGAVAVGDGVFVVRVLIAVFPIGVVLGKGAHFPTDVMERPRVSWERSKFAQAGQAFIHRYS